MDSSSAEHNSGAPLRSPKNVPKRHTKKTRARQQGNTAKSSNVGSDGAVEMKEVKAVVVPVSSGDAEIPMAVRISISIHVEQARFARVWI